MQKRISSVIAFLLICLTATVVFTSCKNKNSKINSSSAVLNTSDNSSVVGSESGETIILPEDNVESSISSKNTSKGGKSEKTFGSKAKNVSSKKVGGSANKKPNKSNSSVKSNQNNSSKNNNSIGNNSSKKAIVLPELELD